MIRNNAEIWTFPQSPGYPLTSDNVYNTIVKYIQTGIILPGSRLPSYRIVARLNKMPRNTIFRIYKRLESKGWVDPVKGSGTFVSRNFPGYDILYPVNRSVERMPIRLNYNSAVAIHNDHPPSDFIMIGFDTPNPHYLSHWSYQAHINTHAKAHALYNQLDRVNSVRSLDFKNAILGYLNNTRNFMIDSSCLEVILGRTESLQQIFKVLLSPCDIVVNTAPRDIELIRLIRDCGAVSHFINTSEIGFLAKLKDFLNSNSIKLLYIRPQCSYLESHTVSENDCRELLELAKQHGFCILEEDDHHEFWHEKKPFQPLICRNHAGHVIYNGALSLLSGYLQHTRTIAAAAEFIRMMQLSFITQSPFRDILAEQAITTMLNNNSLQSNIRKMQREKKEHMFEVGMQLINAFGNVVNVVKPSAGLSFWLEFPSACTLREAIFYLQRKNIEVPFNPFMRKPTFQEKYVCCGFGTWDIMEVQTPAKLLFEKLHQ